MNKDELVQRIEELERDKVLLSARVVMLKCEIDIEKTHWTRLALEKNAFVEMVQTLFRIHVFCRETRPDGALLWDVKDTRTGEEIIHHEPDVIQAYRRAILFRLPDTYVL